MSSFPINFFKRLIKDAKIFTIKRTLSFRKVGIVKNFLIKKLQDIRKTIFKAALIFKVT